MVDQDSLVSESPRVVHASFGFLSFDAEGRQSRESAEKSMRDAVDLFASSFPTHGEKSNVVGEQAFRQRRYKVEHTWKPSNEVMRILDQAVASGSRPTRRAKARRPEVPSP